MILIYSNEIAETAWADGVNPELENTHSAVIGELSASGELVDTNELGVEDVTVIGHHNGKPVETRGPFTEGTEWIGGYYLVDVVDRERAVQIAGRFAENNYSPIEIRRLVHTPPTS